MDRKRLNDSYKKIDRDIKNENTKLGEGEREGDGKALKYFS